MKTATMADELLFNVLAKRATHVSFIKNHKGEIELRYRVRNELTTVDKIKEETYEKLLRYFKFKAKLFLSGDQQWQTGAASFMVDGKNLFVKVETHTIKTSKFEALDLTIHVENEYEKFSEIALFVNQLQSMYDAISGSKGGLFIINGLNQCGKTTTALALLKKLSIDNNETIITLENPVEKIIKELTQININEELGITYGAGLKYAMRQKPDTIFVSNLNDNDTMENIIQAVQKGIKVIAITECIDNFEAIEELCEQYNCEEFLRKNLIGISNQLIVVDPENNTKVLFEYHDNEDAKKLIDGEEPLTNIYDFMLLYIKSGKIKK